MLTNNGFVRLILRSLRRSYFMGVTGGPRTDIHFIHISQTHPPDFRSPLTPVCWAGPQASRQGLNLLRRCGLNSLKFPPSHQQLDWCVLTHIQTERQVKCSHRRRTYNRRHLTRLQVRCGWQTQTLEEDMHLVRSTDSHTLFDFSICPGYPAIVVKSRSIVVPVFALLRQKKT